MQLWSLSTFQTWYVLSCSLHHHSRLFKLYDSKITSWCCFSLDYIPIIVALWWGISSRHYLLFEECLSIFQLKQLQNFWEKLFWSFLFSNYWSQPGEVVLGTNLRTHPPAKDSFSFWLTGKLTKLSSLWDFLLDLTSSRVYLISLQNSLSSHSLRK